MGYSTVLFDLDGTLADTLDLIVLAGQHALRQEAGITPPREDLLKGLGRPLHHHLGMHTNSQEQLDRVVKAYRAFQLEHHDRLTRPYAGVNDLVRWLQSDGRTLGVVTSKIEPLARRGLALIGIAECFQIVVGLESTARHKPDPDPLLHAMERLQAEPKDTVYVGDSPFDMQSARGAGIDCIAVTWGAFAPAALQSCEPTHIVHDSHQLRRLLS